MSNRQYKSFRFSVKAVDDAQGLIEAYGSVFENVDEGDDVVDPGSFIRTIKNSKARVQAGKATFLAMMLWNHDTEHFLPIGGWYDLKEDAHGLIGKGKIILDTQLGRDVYTLIKEKVINEFSIGYDVMPSGVHYDKNTGVRHLTELRLWEISPVVFAMNQEALLVGVKGKTMDRKGKPKEKKTFQEHLQENQAQDLLEDWQDIVLNALSCAVLDAFKIGDTPMDDIKQALDAFNMTVLAWTEQGIVCGLSQYLTDSAYSFADSTMQYGSDSKPNYSGSMSRHKPLARKAGRAISAANSEAIQTSVEALHGLADKAMQDMKAHTAAVHSAADDLATVLQGSEAAYGTDTGTPEDNEQEGGKSVTPRQARDTQKRPSEKDTASDDITLALAGLRNLRAVR